MIKELREKIDALEMDKVQGNLFFKGITEKKDENCVQVIKSFLKNQVELAMDIPIKNAFRIGKSKNRPIKAILVNASDKFKIFAHTKNLQGKKNEHKKPYRVEEQLPVKQGAAKNKMRHIMWRNKAKVSTAHRIELSVKKGTLVMGDDNRQYKSRLRIPDDRVLLNLKQDEVDELKAMEIRKGKTITEGESHFTGYVCDVKTIDEVNRAYKYVRFHNFNARHIICAFRLPGPVFSRIPGL